MGQEVVSSVAFEIVLEVASLVVTFLVVGPLIERRVQAAEKKRISLENFQSTITLFKNINRLTGYTLANFLSVYKETSFFLHGDLVLFPAYLKHTEGLEEKVEFADWRKSISYTDKLKMLEDLEKMSTTKEETLSLLRSRVNDVELKLSDSMNEYRGSRSEIQALVHQSTLLFADADHIVREQAGVFISNLWLFLSDWESIYEICSHLIRTLEHDKVRIPDLFKISAAEGSGSDSIATFVRALDALRRLGSIVHEQRAMLETTIPQKDWEQFEARYMWLCEIKRETDD